MQDETATPKQVKVVAKMKASKLASICKDIAENYNTLYVYGCIGSLLTADNYARYTSRYTYNQSETLRSDYKKAIAQGDVFGFDCVCLIKSILWGWNGNPKATYGGAVYKSNGVPDYNADGFFKTCSGISTDFTNIEIGEAVWKKGHIGVYIGNGLAVECTPSWKNGVQITACNKAIAGYPTREWTKHGKLPYVSYEEEKTEEEKVVAKTVMIELPVLRKGDRGASVKTVQRLLKALGYKGSNGLSLTVDGDFGGNTDYAVRNYQKANGLAVDGVVGLNTYKSILEVK